MAVGKLMPPERIIGTKLPNEKKKIKYLQNLELVKLIDELSGLKGSSTFHGENTMSFDSLFKQLIEDVTDKKSISVEVPVGKLPLKIDVVIKRGKKPVFQGKLKFLEKRLGSINIIEYKSHHDIMKEEDISKLIGYIGLYADKNSTGLVGIIDKFAGWYITVKRPPFLKELKKRKRIKRYKSVTGIYKANVNVPKRLYVLVINDLAITRDSLPLMPLSSGETFREFLRFLIREQIPLDPFLERYLLLRYYIDYEEVHDMAEINELLPPRVKNNIRMAVKEIGVKEVVDAVGVKEVVDAYGGWGKMIDAFGLKNFIDEVGIERVIDKVDIEKVIDEVGLERVIRAAGPERVQKVLDKLARDDGKE
ncbi:MAG: hypothetical protein ACTSWN_00405 [Promethearchaeota archaeon]